MSDTISEGRGGDSGGGTSGERSGAGSRVFLAFFGAVTASVSHELNNVISVIHQISGLLKDMCEAADEGHPPALARLRDVQARITRQVQRGEVIIKNMNRFAHSVDEPERTYDVGATLENFGALCGRWCDQRQVRLQWDLPDGKLSITGDPFRLQLAVYVGLRDRLAVAEPGDMLRMAVAATADGLRMTLVGPNRGEMTAARAAALDEMAAVCAADWSESAVRDGLALAITVPSRTQAA